MSAEPEGSWAREYRQGRAGQVRQQEIANLIAISSVPFLTIDQRLEAAARAFDLLAVSDFAGSAAPVRSAL